MVNAYPLFVEPVPPQRRESSPRCSCCRWRSVARIGDPLNGRIFDIYNSYRPLFLMMAVYTALAFVAVLFVPQRAGEAETGPDSIDPSAPGRDYSDELSPGVWGTIGYVRTRVITRVAELRSVFRPDPEKYGPKHVQLPSRRVVWRAHVRFRGQ